MLQVLALIFLNLRTLYVFTGVNLMNLGLIILRRVDDRAIAGLIYFVCSVIIEHDVVLADDGSTVSSSVRNERHLVLLLCTHLLLGAPILCVFF